MSEMLTQSRDDKPKLMHGMSASIATPRRELRLEENPITLQDDLFCSGYDKLQKRKRRSKRRGQRERL